MEEIGGGASSGCTREQIPSSREEEAKFNIWIGTCGSEEESGKTKKNDVQV